MVHHSIYKFRPLPNATETLGRVFIRRLRRLYRHGHRDCLGLPRYVNFPYYVPSLLIILVLDQITSKSANFEIILSLLSSFFVPEDENALMFWIEKTLGDKKLRTSLRQWREDWRDLVKTGKDSSALL